MLLSSMTEQLRDSLTTNFYPPVSEVLGYWREIRSYLPNHDVYDSRMLPLLSEVLDAFLSKRINAVALVRALQVYLDWQAAVDFAPNVPTFETLKTDIYALMPEDWQELV